MILGYRFQVSGFGFRASDFEVSDFVLRISCFGFRASDFVLRISSFGFLVSDFEFISLDKILIFNNLLKNGEFTCHTP
jgi:hypothetical protein